MFDLHGKRALVTGSSRGIGRAIALTLAEAGADVIVHCTGRPDAAQSVSDSIRAMGRRSLFIQKNLMDADCADVIWRQAEEAFGGADILVLNASIQYKKGWESISAQDFDEQMSVNTRASMQLIQKAVPFMRAQSWGRILAIGSVQEAKPHPDMLVYSASEAAQTMMIRSLAAQLAPFGITVNAIAPGWIDTPMFHKAVDNDPPRLAKIMGRIPAKETGDPMDIGMVTAFLCSDAARYISGSCIPVDGGALIGF